MTKGGENGSLCGLPARSNDLDGPKNREEEAAVAGMRSLMLKTYLPILPGQSCRERSMRAYMI